MNRIWKTLLLWLLIAMLPLQGAAAAIKLSCGSFSAGLLQNTDIAQTHHPENTTHAQAENHSMHIHSALHHQPMNMMAHAEHETNAAEQGNQYADQHTLHSQDGFCSACAACCFGSLAMPSAVSQPPFHKGSDIVNVAPLPLTGSHIPASLERPPRRILA